MAIISVRKNEGESNESLVRRFVRKVQASGNLLVVKKNQYRQRPPSKRLKRRSAILRNEARLKREYLRKIGKLEETDRFKKKGRR